MRKYGILFLFVIAVFSGIVCFCAEKPVKYVFLFIGDGMSTPQRLMAREYCKRTGKEDLLINNFPANSKSTTHSLSRVTDSAASGTAIACGSKTRNGAIGVDEKGQRLESVAEAAHKAGRRVGIITSVSIDHATPAAFYAHNPSRGNYYEIGTDLPKSGFDFFCGGYFKKPGGSDKKPSLYGLAKKNGYTVIKNKPAFEALKPGCGKVLAVFSDSYVIDKNLQTIDLPALTAKGIELLDNPNGFFMMVEGGRIDWACHSNDAATAIKETLEFDSAVKVAYEFAKKHPGETLIVVTGDHETGGLNVGQGGAASGSGVIDNQKVSVGAFTGMFKKLLKSKDCSYEKTRKLLTKYFGFKFTGDPSSDPMVLTAKQKERLKAAYESSVSSRDKKKKKKSILYGSHNPVSITAVHIMAEKVGIAWKSFGHSALPVWTSAYGADAAAFNNAKDNTDIAKLLRPAVSLPLGK